MPHARFIPRQIPLWLFACALMVMGMTAIGAITRLTGSGLSITEWNVISGTLPPLNETAWQNEFAKYQATPEFAAKHHWMDLGDFKKIYFWEWFHRLWGRLIGVVFALPLAFFWIKGTIKREDRLKFLSLLALGGLQGALGWFMVQSGLVDRPSVSHFRLAAHLSLALVIYSALLWTAIEMSPSLSRRLPEKFFPHTLTALMMTFATIIWGGFVAGLDAGMIYNSFPTMGDNIWPPELGTTPFLYDPASVQFTHRILAIITGIIVLSLAARLWGNHHRALSIITGLWILIQISLGIATLLSVVAIPLAVMHQIGAVILLSILIYTVSISRKESSRA